MVTWRNLLHSPAPSMEAASYNSVGMPLRPASRITELAPKMPHRLMRMKAGMASAGSKNQLGLGMLSRA